MALILLTIFVAAIHVAYCYPTAFQALEGSSSSSKYPRCKVHLHPSAPHTLLCVTGRTSIKFLAIGDWGGVPHPPYITPVQKATAREMSEVAEQMGADFVLALGDNFYYKGVDSVDSPRFKVGREGVCEMTDAFQWH